MSSATTTTLPRRRSRSPEHGQDQQQLHLAPPSRDSRTFTLRFSASQDSREQERRVPSAKELFRRVFDQQRTGSTGPVSLTPIGVTEMSVRRVIGSIWADTTWGNRGHEWERFKEFCALNNFDMWRQLDYAAACWVESTRSTTLPSSRLKYVQDIISLAKRFEVPTPICRMYASGLRHSGALIPQHQAPSVTIEQLTKLRRAALMETTGEQLCAVLFLMWKSASRADEVLRLRGTQILELTPRRVVIEWGANTKASATRPFRLDMLSIVEHDPRLPNEVFRVLQAMQRQRAAKITIYTTAWLDRWMKRVLPGEEISAHSIKHGAVKFLVQQATLGRLAPHLVSRLAKHLHEGQATPIAEMTARYNDDKVATAVLLETHLASILLPWVE